MRWLEVALNSGIKERDFWQMTIGELDRELQAKRKREVLEAQERATYDYILADMIGRSMSRLYSSAATMPEIGEMYPTLFDTEELKEKKQEAKDKLSAVRFRQFAETFNRNFKEVAKDSDD